MAGYFVECVENELQDARTRDDDWTGKTDPAERKKRQNRLHQRAWRRRKALQHVSVPKSSSIPACREGTSHLNNPSDLMVRYPADGGASLRQLVQDHVSGRRRMPISFELPQSRDALWAALETLGEPQSFFAYWAELRAQRKREIAAALLSQNSPLALHLRSPQYHNTPTNFERSIIQAIKPYLPSNDQGPSTYNLPPSDDHHLFTLIQHNALRGIMTNMSILLHLNNRPFEGWADFYLEDLPVPSSAPPSLLPTLLQKTTPHETWIDVIPYAKLRDNIIKHQDMIDADELCEDFLGGMEGGLSEVQKRGMILWGEPWSEDGWEISEGFVRKWGVLMEGCGELIGFTNRWRETRGEERLVVEV